MPLSALKGEGAVAVADTAIQLANEKPQRGDPHVVYRGGGACPGPH